MQLYMHSIVKLSAFWCVAVIVMMPNKCDTKPETIYLHSLTTIRHRKEEILIRVNDVSGATPKHAGGIRFSLQQAPGERASGHSVIPRLAPASSP